MGNELMRQYLDKLNEADQDSSASDPYDSITMNYQDRILYGQIFAEMQDPKKRQGENPYRPNTISGLAWEEGRDVYNTD